MEFEHIWSPLLITLHETFFRKSQSSYMIYFSAFFHEEPLLRIFCEKKKKKSRKTLSLPFFGVTLSWRRPLSYRNQSNDLQSKSVDWFPYDNGLRDERVKELRASTSYWTRSWSNAFQSYSIKSAEKSGTEAIQRFCEVHASYIPSLLYKSQLWILVM